MSTKEKLANALKDAGAPTQMVDRALRGEYDDYESPSATPIGNLIRDLRTVGLHDLAVRTMNGEFDGTREEADAWFQKEGRHLV